MTYLPNNSLPILLSSLALIIGFFSFLFFISMNSLKKEEFQRLSFISRKISKEKELSKKLDSKIKLMTGKESSIKKNLFQIRLEILHIDFSTKEIINHMGRHLSS